MLRGFRGACIGLFLFWGAWVSYAQTGQGILTGSLTDSTGATLPGASVVVRNQNTGFTYTAVTTQEGLYRVPYLNVGTYEVTFEAQGFKKLVRNDIPIRSLETRRLDVTMELGNVVESVKVSAGAQLLETETSTTGHLVTGTELTTLPSPQLKIESMLWYVSGVTRKGATGTRPGGGRARSSSRSTE